MEHHKTEQIASLDAFYSCFVINKCWHSEQTRVDDPNSGLLLARRPRSWHSINLTLVHFFRDC